MNHGNLGADLDDIDIEYNKNFEKKFNELFEKRIHYYIKLKIDNLIEKVSNMKSYIIFYPILYITKNVLTVFSNMFEEKLAETQSFSEFMRE